MVSKQTTRGSDLYSEALKQPLNLTSTRSHDGADAHRDMVGFDPDEELARLRRAVDELRDWFSGKPEDVIRIVSADALTNESIQNHVKRLQEEAKVDDRFLHWLKPSVGVAAALVFIAHAIDNLDEHMRRGGTPPTAWQQSKAKSAKKEKGKSK